MSNKKMIKKMFDEEYNRKKIKEEIVTNYEKSINKKVKCFKWYLVPLCLILIILLISTKTPLKTSNDKNFDIDRHNSDNDSFENGYNDSKNDNKDEKYVIHIEIGSNDSYDGIFYDISDINLLAKKSDIVAIVRIDSIDGSTKRYRISHEKAGYIFTYGNATVLKTIQGDLKNNKLIYKKPGGRLPYLEWVEADTDPEKLLSLVRANDNKIDGVPIKDVIIEEKRKGVIDIAEGKIYLAFMMKGYEYSDDYNEYAFIGHQYGLREVKNYDINNQTLSGVKVKNNETGKWEDISKVINFTSTK